MKLLKIAKTKWAQSLESAAKAYQLYGPVEEKDYHAFKALEKGEMPDFEMVNTRLSPKSILFPQSEKMLSYSLDEKEEDHHIIKEVEKDYSPRAVIGMRPCDAKAVCLVNMNFDTPEVKDPYWVRALEATTVIGLGCDAPLSTCFCTSTGCGPYNEEGLDILLVDGGEDYLIKILSEKGEAFADAAGWSEPSDDSALVEEKRAAAEEKIVSAVNTDNLADSVILDLHGAGFWDDVSFACLNCGTCTFSCPTCWCFDIQDEVHGKAGMRLKNWDSCMFPIFTIHTTGHNPRDTKTQRVRQRFMHKLKYFVDKYEKGIMCVGCGRCVRQCPVNIDIRKVCELMNSYSPEETCSVQG